LSGLRILVVEDSWHVAKAMTTLLKVLGADPAGPVATTAEAERLISERHPDLALVDVNLRNGELAYDLITLSGDEVPPAAALGAYVALVSDTGSFRFSNTTPRSHVVAARLLQRGIDPEWVYRRLFATAPLRRLELLRAALDSLQVEMETGIAWMVLPSTATARLEATGEDFDGLIEHARSIEGTEVAMLFRGMPDGKTKVSFRSNGHADVNRLARRFGGGGHVKAAGALLDGPADVVAERVVPAVREALRG